MAGHGMIGNHRHRDGHHPDARMGPLLCSGFRTLTTRWDLVGIWISVAHSGIRTRAMRVVSLRQFGPRVTQDPRMGESGVSRGTGTPTWPRDDPSCGLPSEVPLDDDLFFSAARAVAGDAVAQTMAAPVYLAESRSASGKHGDSGGKLVLSFGREEMAGTARAEGRRTPNRERMRIRRAVRRRGVPRR